MTYITCTSTFTDEVIANTMKFWAQNSFQHIDVLLQGYQGTGAVLQPQFQRRLNRIADDFRDIYNGLNIMPIPLNIPNNIPLDIPINIPNNVPGNIRSTVREFLRVNRRFTRLLERIKFEGFNGYPALSEVVNHFIYEQEYVQEIFSPLVNREPNNDANSVILNTTFNDELYGKGVLECIYSNLYFWSLIGAEHTSIIETATGKDARIPTQTRRILESIRNAFNQINFLLSQAYPNIDKANLLEIYRQFRSFNNVFLRVLRDLNSNQSQLFPQSSQQTLPALYYDVLQHLIDEHRYAREVGKSLREYLRSDE